MKRKFLIYEESLTHSTIYPQEQWVLKHVVEIEKQLQQISSKKRIIWDFTHLEAFDSAGVLLFITYYEQLKAQTEVEVVGYTTKQKEMYLLLKTQPKKTPPPKTDHFIQTKIESILAHYHLLKDFCFFLGRLFYTFFYTLLHPKEIRIKETVYHIHKSGVNALVIIGLTAFLVGMVISYQGSVQLAKFGADIFIVDTVAISMTRELAPMITAIVIAGRSGSAYTAEIGAMKITEEIAAMRTMGFDPYTFLVLPRIFALVIALPLLIFFADILGIVGGMFAAWMELNISVVQFTNRLYEVLEVKHYLLGMMKAPLFAFVIASIGCFRGLQVSDNTESIGHHTTASVVNAIFLVIAFDALFSVIFTELGL